jgi:CspA family cold shock protein
MKTATVKFWSEARGFGFLVPEDGGPEVFVHVSNLEDPDLEALARGARVEFEEGLSARTGKSEAIRVRVLDASPASPVTR